MKYVSGGRRTERAMHAGDRVLIAHSRCRHVFDSIIRSWFSCGLRRTAPCGGHFHGYLPIGIFDETKCIMDSEELELRRASFRMRLRLMVSPPTLHATYCQAALLAGFALMRRVVVSVDPHTTRMTMPSTSSGTVGQTYSGAMCGFCTFLYGRRGFIVDV